MSDIERRMAEWRKNLWGAGPCPDSSRENFRLTDAEREAVELAHSRLTADTHYASGAATLRGMLERLRGAR